MGSRYRTSASGRRKHRRPQQRRKEFSKLCNRLHGRSHSTLAHAPATRLTCPENGGNLSADGTTSTLRWTASPAFPATEQLPCAHKFPGCSFAGRCLSTRLEGFLRTR